MIHKRERQLLVNLYKDLKVENPRITKSEAYSILSKKTGYGKSSIKKTLLHYETTGTVESPNKKKQRIPINQLVDELDRCAIRRKVHQFFINKELPNLSKVLQAVNNDENLPNFKRTTFWKLLKDELNFTFISRQGNSILTERDDLIIRRRNYLRDVRKFRDEGRPVYYLDETWVSAGDVGSKLCSKPSGKGKRLILSHIGSTNGFLPGGLLCFESKKNTADHYDEMNNDRFFEWFERILPSIEDNGVIVMDDAPYHSEKLEELPNSSWRKTDIIAWLESKGKAGDASMLKAELLNMVSIMEGNFNKYVIDEKAKQHNKTVLRLPPYHCELNPIEIIWSMVKAYVKSHNTSFKINDVKRLVEEGVEHVTSEDWTNCIKHVIEEEKKMWEVDEIADRIIDEIEPIFVDVNAGSDSDSDSSD